MTTPVFLGVSLKMYFDHAATLRWVDRVAAIAADSEPVLAGRVEVAVLPGFLSVPTVSDRTRSTPLVVGAQDLAWADSGAYTGEISGVDLAGFGCRYVEVGHAERRRLFAEDDGMIAAKTAAAARNGLTPILCVGESDPGDPEAAAAACLQQVGAALTGLPAPLPELIIAYEPIWAIGAERPAGSDHIASVCRQLRAGLSALPAVGGSRPLERVRVIYGGSAGPGILRELSGAVDGLFLGRFAHDPDAVAAIIAEADATTDRTDRADR